MAVHVVLLEVSGQVGRDGAAANVNARAGLVTNRR